MENPTILVADDNADDVELLRRAFSKAGFGRGLHAVRGGQQVIEYLKGDGDYADRNRFPLPRLVLLDFRMQGLSGEEVLRWIRQRSEFKHLPVIVFSGSEYQEDINKAYDLGANSYLIKPQALDELISAVEHIGQFWLQLSRLPESQSLRPR